MTGSQLAQVQLIEATVGDRIVRVFNLFESDGTTAYTSTTFTLTPSIVDRVTGEALTVAGDWNVTVASNSVTVELDKTTFTDPVSAMWSVELSLGTAGADGLLHAVGGPFLLRRVGTTRPVATSATGVYDLTIDTEASTAITISAGVGGAGLTSVDVPDDLNTTGTASASTFLRGDGAWASPAGGGDMLAANNLSDVASAATSRTNLGVAIGTDVQAWSAVLDATTASFLTADETKLDGIETAATADQTGAEIKTAYEAEADTNAYNDAAVTKLAGIETAADVTDATNVAAAGAHMAGGTDVPVTDGGTGASDAATARTNLGVDAAGTDNSTDVTIAGEDFLSLAGQALTANPIDLDNLSATGTPTSSNYLRGDNTWATPAGGGTVDTSGTPVANDIARFTDADTIEGRSYSEARADLGVPLISSGAGAPGSTPTTVGDIYVDTTGDNAYVAAGTASSADWKQATGAGGGDLLAANNLSDVASAATARTNLGVDAAGTDNSTDVTIAGTPDYITLAGQVLTRGLVDLATDVTGDLPVADGGTGASTAAAARTNLGVAIGTNVQAYAAALDSVTGTNTGDEPDASATVKGIVELATDAETATGTDTARAVTPANVASAYVPNTALPVALQFALSDDGAAATAITTGTAKLTVRMPFAMTLTDVRASLTTASSSGIPTVDINEGGVTILSTKLTIDASETTSTTAATAAVISDSALADDAEITFDVDVAGTGAKGLKVTLIGTRDVS